MAYSTGSLILDDDYNIFATGNAAGSGDNNVANINTVWGSGTSDKGYGQTNTVSAVSAGATVTATQWSTLLSRISSAASHQGSSITAISNPVAGDTISAYAALSTNITTIFNNRLNAAASGSTTTTNTDRTTSWVTSVTFTQTVTFASAAAARYFFNAGGRITVSYSRTGGSTNDQNTAIANLCTACGTLTFTAGTATQTIAGGSFTGTTKTGGSGSATISTGTGWYDLTTANVQVFTQSASSYYGYEGNSITVNLRTATSDTQLVVASVVAKSGALTTVDGTLRASLSIIPPGTGFLTATWGTPTVSGSQSGS
jgi:hypothetical protein